jgi:transcriptional regulator GlxA family with amidase domain
MGAMIANELRVFDWTTRRSKTVHTETPLRLFRKSALNQGAGALAASESQPDETASPKRIGVIVFAQMSTGDLAGPAEVFSLIKAANGRLCERCCYQVVALGVSAEPCVTESGIIVKPQFNLQNAPQLDTVIVPGGVGIHDPKVNKKITNWLDFRARKTRRIAALGTGVYALASTGLLDQRQVVIHWRFAKDVALRFPKLRVNPDCLFVKDGPFYTCAGGAAAIDLSLALVEEDYGRQIALELAHELVVQIKRSGGQGQYSEALQFQIQSSDRFADLPAWISSNLGQDLSVDALAERACMSRRNFTRLFKKTFGKAPAQFVADARITEARRRLLVPRNNLESIAASLGFKSADVFSKAFERQIGIRPNRYRARSRTWRTKKNSGDLQTN